MSEDEERQRAMMDLVPADWDVRPMILAAEIRKLLAPIVDQGTAIDSGGGDGLADLWITVDGIEFMLSIKQTKPPR